MKAMVSMEKVQDKISQLKDSYKLKIKTISKIITDLELEKYSLKEKNSNNGRQRKSCQFLDLIEKMVFLHLSKLDCSLI